MVTVANARDEPSAILIFTAMLLLHQLRIRGVGVDAAYFSYAFSGFIQMCSALRSTSNGTSVEKGEAAR
jgi:hypothetical protein